MNPQDPLANLHPLRQPEAIGWWPPAPGWWLLALLVFIALFALCYLAVSHYRKNRYRRIARQQQTLLYKEFQQDHNLQGFASATNALLKSVALRAWPRREIAALHGREWLQFLNSTAPGDVAFAAAFVEDIYNANPGNLDAEQLQQTALIWIAKHRNAQ